MPYIASYSFGRMEIERTVYSRDLIILPNGEVSSPWWRQEGHRLQSADLEKLLGAGPEIIVAGTGASGLMKPSRELESYLVRLSIVFIALPSAEAVHEYNRLFDNGKTGACFHLTC